jgi:signal transduction histidine kinase
MLIPEVLESRTYIFKFFLYSSCIAIALSTLLLYFLVRRMTQPLKEINNAARIIAKGDFEERLDVKSKDEVGQLAESFNYMAAELQNIENNRRLFVANVSHELRTPMTSIRGFVSGILDGTIPADKQSKYLEIVRDEAERLGRLVTDLLDLSRIESGESRLVLKIVDINEIIRKCIIKLENYINRKGIRLEMIFDADPLKVSADADAIERVIINLVHNAIKFTKDGGTIIISVIPKKNSKVEISVKDNGAGIEQSELEKIFERFYKSDKSRSDDRKGTGLGLAIVKNIIREHKQEIFVDSKVGVGSTFTFTLDRV